MSSTASEPRAVAPGVTLRLPLPEAARRLSDAALPSVDVSAIAGARVTLRAGIKTNKIQLMALCVRAPSARWAPGAESLVLERASWLARAAVGGDVDRWDAAPIEADGDRFEQRFEGVGRAGAQAVAVRGRHTLGFAGKDHDAVLCSVVCVESAPGEIVRCAALVDAARLEGALVAPPPPSALVRAILLAAGRPAEAAAVSAMLALALVVVVLARRPRPRPFR